MLHDLKFTWGVPGVWSRCGANNWLAIVLVVFFCPVLVNGQQCSLDNGEFEDLPNTSWTGVGQGNPLNPDPEITTDCNSAGLRGLRIGTDGNRPGKTVSLVYQGFKCDGPLGNWCTITFKAKFFAGGGGGEIAYVGMHDKDQPGDSKVRKIPASPGFVEYKISTHSCTQDVVLVFGVENKDNQGDLQPLQSQLCIDEISCECTDNDTTTPVIENNPYDPETPFSPNDPPSIGEPGTNPVPTGPGVRNGGFEDTDNPVWVGTATGASGVGPGVEGQCASAGLYGIRIGAQSATKPGKARSEVLQVFNCAHQPDPDDFCTISFKAQFIQSDPNEKAWVELKGTGTDGMGNPIEAVQKEIPVGAGFVAYSISVEKACRNPAIIRFGINAGGNANVKSRLCIDEVSSGCTGEDATSPQLVSDITPEFSLDTCCIPSGAESNSYILPSDCNGNEVPDAHDILVGTSADLDGDGFPDECAVGVIPTLTEWGIIIFSILLFGWMAWILVRRRRAMSM